MTPITGQISMYDIFYVSKGDIVEEEWQKIKKIYPTAQCISNVSTFEQIRSRAFTKMFWIVWDDLELEDDFTLTEYRATKWDDGYIHVFLNGEHYDGICLFPKQAILSSKEFKNRFFVNKKQVGVVASVPKRVDFDIVFISYNEANADKNYQRLKQKFSNVKRVVGVKGIHQAHIQAAKLSSTELFWAVDGDAIVADDFYFDYIPPYYERDSVYVWRSQNPINDLEYGYGGVKLLPRQLTLDMDIDSPDMTTAISKKFKAMPMVSNITEFNTDPYSAWRSAFRECVKLSSRIINRQISSETEKRLETWCTVGNDRPFGKFAISGAIAGKEFGHTNKGNPIELSRINDFEWLKTEFKKHDIF